MTIPIVKTAMESDEANVLDALKLAFATDPAVRWVWPDPQKYLSFSLVIVGCVCKNTIKFWIQ